MDRALGAVRDATHARDAAAWLFGQSGAHRRGRGMSFSDAEPPTITPGAPITHPQAAGPYELVYIDGGHEYATAAADLDTFAPMVASGGFLVVSDFDVSRLGPDSI